ncbi:MAG: hypothetical protein K6F69_05850 [Treponema sp.]|nr:hypothetical protein [Treponema sp.]
MYQAVQELIDQQTKAVSEEMVKKLLRKNTLTVQEISDSLDISLDEVKRLQAEIQAE